VEIDAPVSGREQPFAGARVKKKGKDVLNRKTNGLERLIMHDRRDNSEKRIILARHRAIEKIVPTGKRSQIAQKARLK